MALFQPETGLIFWMLVVFLIILGILAKYAWPVIIQSIDRRAAFIDQGVEYAREAKKELEDAGAQVRQMMAEMHKRQLDALQETERMRKEMIEEAKKEARGEARKIMDEAKASVEHAKREAEQQLRKQVSALALEIAGKVLRQDLSADTRQMELIGKMLDEEENKN